MTERPPNEVAAAPRWTDAQLDELQAECLRRHLLDPLWKKIADALGSVRFDKVDLTRELSEARAAREKGAISYIAWRERAIKAEVACREHAEAIGVLRAPAQFVIDYQEMPVDEFQAKYPDYDTCGDHAFQDYAAKLARNALANPVAAQEERERRAEREAVLIEAAKAMCLYCANDFPMRSEASVAMHQGRDGYGETFVVPCSASPILELAALPASPPAQAASPPRKDQP